MTGNNTVAHELREAAVWGMTMVLFHEYLKISEDTGVERNRFYVDTKLPTPAHKTPGANVETIYGFAWLDLADGPQVLEVPDTNDRYYCLQMFDACFQTIAYVGRRTTGTAAGAFLIAGPAWSGTVPDGMALIQFPTDLVYVMPRMQVRDAQDPADIAEAGRLLESLVLGSLAEYPDGRVTPVVEEDATGARFPTIDLDGMGAEYFDRLCALLTTQPPPPMEAPLLERFAEVGIGPGLKPSTNPDLTPHLADALREALAEVRAVQPMAMLGDGPWMTSMPIRDVGPLEPKLRARMNLDAPGFHPAVEAVYAALVTAADGSPLTGERSYRLRFPPGGIPPVGAFWSMTMYAMPGMRLVENAINRYAIGSNFDTLEYGPDGSLELLLARDQPDSGISNWLPTPPEQFMVLCRLYQPGIDVIDGRYSMPPATAI